MKIKLNVTTSELSQYDLGGFGTFGEMKRLDALKWKRKAIKLKCVATLNDEFDESDIEKYIGAIKKIAPNVLHIKLGKKNHKPKYKALCEVHDAIEHFCKPKRVYYDKKVELYVVEEMDMTVIFDYVPV